MIGRGSRIFPDKHHFNILDFGENSARFGGYTTPQNWDLWHETSKGKGLPPIKECGIIQDLPQRDKNGRIGCGRMIMASVKICEHCGYTYPEKKAKAVELMINERLGDNEILRVNNINDMTNRELKKFAEIKRYKSPWLWSQLYLRGGIEEIEKFALEFNWKPMTLARAMEFVNRKFVEPGKQLGQNL